ncbi:MAG: Gfo/Idh/MocA family protein [Phocaeicola sp.]
MRKIRFGFVGTNFISDWVLAGALLDSRFELAAVYSRTQESGQAFAAKYGVDRVFTNLQEMAEWEGIDAVYIASPNALHCEQSLLFIEQGKHVLCEKAFCSNAREARTLVTAARSKGVLLMEALKPTLTPNFAQVMEHINQLGPIRKYFASYCQYSSRYDKLKEGVVLNAFRPELSNGALMDIGIYTIYPMVVLLGRPKTIQATGMLLPTGVDGEGSVIFGYDTLSATVIYSKITESALPSEVQGELGTIRIDRINQIDRVQLLPRGSEAIDLTQPHCGEEYYYEVKHFIDLIEQGKTESPINSLDNSIIAMEVMDEIRRQIGVVYPADTVR